MPELKIPNFSDVLMERLRWRAKKHGRSIAEEARIILLPELGPEWDPPQNLVELTREIFGPVGGVVLDIPAREPMRGPSDFGSEDEE